MVIVDTIVIKLKVVEKAILANLVTLVKKVKYLQW